MTKRVKETTASKELGRIIKDYKLSQADRQTYFNRHRCILNEYTTFRREISEDVALRVNLFLEIENMFIEEGRDSVIEEFECYLNNVKKLM